MPLPELGCTELGPSELPVLGLEPRWEPEGRLSGKASNTESRKSSALWGCAAAAEVGCAAGMLGCHGGSAAAGGGGVRGAGGCMSPAVAVLWPA